MDLDDTIKRLKSAPRAGRKEFGQTVVLSEAAVDEIVEALENAKKDMAKKTKEVKDAKEASYRKPKASLVRGAEPE